ncbi:ELKS/Rab6-interacting/CAST family member 1 [Cloeon dipterum]|uniref:ELKS/Rab6-interacting/CAST family member 1 n=1 Tax=Cloeon dipterum TaxID=197152 RepID=UPI00321FD63F
MSDFYGRLAKDALEDDVSDVSDGELQEMLANMDDLDAGLFGTANIPKTVPNKSPSPPLPDPDVQESYKIIPAATKSAPLGIPKSKKSELLAELFGSDVEEVLPKEVKPKIEFDIRQPPSNPAIPIVREKDDVQGSLNSYEPSPGIRGRRRAGKPKPTEVLWEEFLQPEKYLEKPRTEEKDAKVKDNRAPLHLEILKTEDELVPRVEERRRVADAIPAPQESKPVAAAVKFELTDKMKEQILAMIKEEQQKQSEDINSRLKEELRILKQQNLEFKERLGQLEGLVASQKENIKELNKALENASISFTEQLDVSLEQFQRTLQEQNLMQKEKLSALQCQLSQLEERVQDMQQEADSIQPVQLSLKEKISSLQAGCAESHEQLVTFISSVREINLEEEKKTRKQLEEKIFKLSSQIGNWEILDRKLDIFEGRLDKIVSSISCNRNEEELVKRLERSENSILHKLNYCSSQQVRHENWHQQQLSNISEHLEQRLWGVQMHLDMVVASLKSEVGTLRTDTNNRMGDMENKVISAEDETSRLSRLAERLCALLQLWEVRNRETTKIQQVAEQSLRERFSLAMAEMKLDDK